MTTVVRPCQVGSRLVDCVTKLTAASARALRAAGADGAIRYLGSLDAAELDAILEAGLGLMPVCYEAHPQDWLPTSVLGQLDGALAVDHAHGAGILPGTSLWCDLEAMGGSAADTIAYAVAWCAEVEPAGFVPGGYIGSGVTLSTEQLYALPFRGYWHSLSEVPNVARVGYQLVQLYPTTHLAGIEVDIDFSQHDKAGRAPQWMIRELPAAGIGYPLPFSPFTQPPTQAA